MKPRSFVNVMAAAGKSLSFVRDRNPSTAVAKNHATATAAGNDPNFGNNQVAKYGVAERMMKKKPRGA